MYESCSISKTIKTIVDGMWIERFKATLEHIGRTKATARAHRPESTQARIQVPVQSRNLTPIGHISFETQRERRPRLNRHGRHRRPSKATGRTKKVTTGKGQRPCGVRSYTTDFAIVNDSWPKQMTTKQTIFVMQAFVTGQTGRDTAPRRRKQSKYYTIVVFPDA